MMKSVLVVGDTILDKYVYGTVDRVNPEAPHSVVLDYERDDLRLGGAANVARNIRSLAGNSVEIVYFGATSDIVKNLLEDSLIKTGPPTHYHFQILEKTRFVCDFHHILRVDRNKKYDFNKEFEDKLIQNILLENSYDLIVVSDYNKGTLNSLLSKRLFDTDLPVLFDVKNHLNLPVPALPRKDNVILKCNKKEFYNEISTEQIHSVRAVVETRGREGFYVHRGLPCVFKSPESPSGNHIVDVVGAGDTFLAGMAVEFLTSGNLDPVALGLAGNAAAQIKIQHFGTFAVKK